jgi:2-haloacid dehalogenase
LDSLDRYDLAILSNGNPEMLNALVRNTGLDEWIKTIISVDPARNFKPSPRAYALIEERLGLPPSEVIFVSSNPFDICGAKAFGMNVVWIERVTPSEMAAAFDHRDRVPPVTMFRAIRQQMDELGCEPDYRISSLTKLADLLEGDRQPRLS